jgi:ABC transporter DrrB family efflux protein
MMQAIAPPHAPPRATRATLEIARRALRKFFRTPGLFVMSVVQSAMFLLSFRFVFGGAINTGGSTYVNYLIPGFVATVLLFTGGGIAVGVAEDRVQGFTDRLLSLPLPRRAIVLGRALADSTTNAWSIVTTAAIGFLVGFRLGGSLLYGLAALGLCLVYCVVFTVVFIVMGLLASNAQTAQGLSLIGSIFAFVSSAYVPVVSMPGWLQAFAGYQPITPMVNAVRALTVGSTKDVVLALAWSALLLAVFTPIAIVRYRRAS